METKFEWAIASVVALVVVLLVVSAIPVGDRFDVGWGSVSSKVFTPSTTGTGVGVDADGNVTTITTTTSEKKVLIVVMYDGGTLKFNASLDEWARIPESAEVLVTGRRNLFGSTIYRRIEFQGER